MTVRFPPAFAICLLLLVWLALPAPTAGAAETITDPETSQVLIDQWTRTLDLVEQEIDRADTTSESSRRFLEVTGRVRKEAIKLRDTAQDNIKTVQRRLDALGPPPEQGEAEELASQRQQLNDQLKGLQARLAQANLAILRADELDGLVDTLETTKRFQALFRIYPLPWSPETWQRALAELGTVIQKIARSPVIWWNNPALQERRQRFPFRLGILLVLALFSGWLLRRWLLRRYGRDPSLSAPGYTRRIVAALANAGARGMIPALLLGGLLYFAWATRVPEQGLFPALMIILLVVGIFFSLAWALPYAVLSPDQPQWRLIAVTPENARILGRRFTLIAALFAISIFLTAAQLEIGVTDTYFSLATFVQNLLPALVLIDTMRASRWTGEGAEEGAMEGAAEAGEAEPEVTPQSSIWRFVRRLVAAIAAASILASFLGYADLGDFLLAGLLFSAFSLAGIYILRGLGREVVGVAVRSAFFRDELQFRHLARSRMKFWLRALLDVIFGIAGALIIASIWLSPFGDFWTDARKLLSGITIGGVTISLADIMAGIAVFAALLIATRLIQRFLRNKVLPETGFDSGVQNSLSAGFGYLGILLAVVVGISTLGIDLSNIALIAGALSVGIGFGLQAVVSNFVSGIILLIERPIKVGDWVAIGASEGTVKKITVRSTELQTFQRASVIIPNSDLIASSVINWTHKDLYGRIEVPVGVAYGSDVERVKQVLLDCAMRHDRVLTSPEPQVLFINFGDSSLDFELRCFTNNVNNRLSISSDIRFEIDRRFREEGIEIPFPQRVLHMAARDPDPHPVDQSLPPEGESHP